MYGMDLTKAMVNAETEAAPVNFDDFIQPFFIKNSSKGNLIEIKLENTPFEDNKGYLYNLLNIKKEGSKSPPQPPDSSGTRKKEKPHKCDTCFYSFKSKYNLALHKKTHLMNKQYSCSYCGYRAVLRTTIKKHMIVHSKAEKEYKCTWCDFQTMYKHSLQFHIKRHTGEKPFQCSICDYRTIQKANLAFHMRHHTGGQYYRCDKCDYRTTNENYLELHVAKHHAGIKKEEEVVPEPVSPDPAAPETENPS